jgi:hypothetical protein
MLYLSAPAATRTANAFARSCSKVWRPMAACTCPSATRRSTAPPWRAGAACRMPTWPLKFSRFTSTTFRQTTLRDPVSQDLHRASVRHHRDRAPAQARGRRLPGSPVQRPDAGLQRHGHATAGQPVRVRAGPPRRRAEHPGRHLRRHRQRRRIRDARQEGRARLHDVAARPHEPLSTGADVQPAGPQHSQHRRSKACSTIARTSSRRSPTT